MARVVAVATDLMLASKVEATLSAVGHEVTLSASLQEAPLDSAELLVADLESGNPEDLVSFGVPVLGYYPHTDVAIKETAEAAGVDLVVPRSRLARELPDLVESLLGGGAG
ncbi:MAG TPA: hypothetical protein VFY48_00835 [Solirubrobacterales bacterium]|nr:hypothetical protein [Solirubrobacterales bacterium]